MSLQRGTVSGTFPLSLGFTLVDGNSTNNAAGYALIQADQDYYVLSASFAVDGSSQNVLKAYIGRVSGGTAKGKTYVTASALPATGQIRKVLLGGSLEAYYQDPTDPDLMAINAPPVADNSEFSHPESWRVLKNQDFLGLIVYDSNTSGSATRYAQLRVTAVPVDSVRHQVA